MQEQGRWAVAGLTIHIGKGGNSGVGVAHTGGLTKKKQAAPCESTNRRGVGVGGWGREKEKGFVGVGVGERKGNQLLGHGWGDRTVTQVEQNKRHTKRRHKLSASNPHY